MPNLVGRNLIDAQAELRGDDVTLTVLPAKGTPGIVTRTIPAAGAPLRPGSKVTLYVGVEPGPAKSPGRHHGHGKDGKGGD
jgi:beta-lactam-binding protein with PASTA domain